MIYLLNKVAVCRQFIDMHIVENENDNKERKNHCWTEGQRADF